MSADADAGQPPGDGEVVRGPLQDQDRDRGLLRTAQLLADLSLEQLWLRFFAVGGAVGLVEVEAYLSGLMPLPARERDMLAQAANERLDEVLRAAHVPYSSGADPDPPRSTELGALLDLLEGSHLAPPDEMPSLAVAAGRLLDVELVVYLVDHDQRLLVAVTAGLPSTSTALTRRPLGIDSTLAGRAFRHVETLPSNTEGHPRLWVPLLDGAECLGVLDVQVGSSSALDDRWLRGQCEHLAHLLAHLLHTAGRQGDALDAVRRRRPRTPAAELAWQLLPPRTGGTDSVTVSGWIEPADIVGGDTFDYALSRSRVSLAVFDAMGHGAAAGLGAAAAVSAYRSARRNGGDLRTQADVIDRTIGSISTDGAFVTGWLGELDLASGRLRYLSAGHPAPLLLRDGKVVRTLTGGRRVPFGLSGLSALGPTVGSAEATGMQTGQEDLQPGDWLVLHTDGVTEARDATGEFFGEARLADFLERAVADGKPPPETARRLAHTVLSHQDGQLQDDATVLLTCWHHR